MKLSEILTEEQVLLDLQAADKWDAIGALAAALARSGRLAVELEEPCREALLVRERSMTTGMENGIAIPHAAVDALPEILAVLAIAPDGIPFDTIDGAPGRILIGLLYPQRQKLQHIRTLAQVARLLSDGEVREALLACRTPAAVLETIRAAE